MCPDAHRSDSTGENTNADIIKAKAAFNSSISSTAMIDRLFNPMACARGLTPMASIMVAEITNTAKHARGSTIGNLSPEAKTLLPSVSKKKISNDRTHAAMK